MSRTEAYDPREEEVLARIERFRRKRPRLKEDAVNLAHGAGGKASAALVDAVFVEAFSNELLEPLGDGAVLELPSGDRLAMSTDSFVVNPWRFPGATIGSLAVHGTVNDLACMGAQPTWMSVAFVLEEGLAVDDLRDIVEDMAEAAARAGVTIVTGDTKVVNKGAADGLYVNTTGVGVIPKGRRLAADLVRPGDKVFVTGNIGDHGMAVMVARGDLNLDADIRSDTAALNGLTETLLDAAPHTRWLRDPTRGGVGTVVNELVKATDLSVVLAEHALPIDRTVLGACDILGIDPLYVANEGKLVAIVPPDEARAALDALRAHELGKDAAVIGEVRAEPAGTVLLQTSFGGSRIVDMLVGDPLPRIC
ncbi:MAG: hydrogenase expression/formation protein HypE [Actinobacteria bacterium]|nr:hydrogenase expression/formation protein HypE [Actinomycetota bacterium]